MNGEITFKLPTELDETMIDTWKRTFGDAMSEIAQQQKTPRYLNQKAAAKYLDVSVNTLKTFCKAGLTPVMVDNITRYDRNDLDEWYQVHKM